MTGVFETQEAAPPCDCGAPTTLRGATGIGDGATGAMTFCLRVVTCQCPPGRAPIAGSLPEFRVRHLAAYRAMRHNQAVAEMAGYRTNDTQDDIPEWS